MTDPLRRVNRDIVRKRGWQSGSDLEDAVAWRLSGVFSPSEVVQQHKVGPYKIDFAWPDVMVALEVDGWHHRSPEGAAKDAQRDAWLRSKGWLVLRIDDRHGLDNLDWPQLIRVCQLVQSLRADAEAGRGWKASDGTKLEAT